MRVLVTMAFVQSVVRERSGIPSHKGVMGRNEYHYDEGGDGANEPHVRGTRRASLAVETVGWR